MTSSGGGATFAAGDAGAVEAASVAAVGVVVAGPAGAFSEDGEADGVAVSPQPKQVTINTNVKLSRMSSFR